ncbi:MULTISPECIES: hypothetical protein [unclassified Mesorhizobium]|uniref:hypothetical protein n=1 Tax=unclassified Mesorhizobium TaxID=325217 RepID=UPI0011296BB6|nr:MULTISPECIES: hypothetical protein [unclassified Mesorhizobium]MBZ9919725.1 hypothetical protein [Mesorhizobium sp. BR1-1-7]MBZ9954336.1 hypothetical protein [Mesorhizobium sp. BR1-1-15]MBZ9969504.1 hypothetical protein [Mesorhizobium sp. BR1-1-12]TPK67287.1 hypothetical protein FJ551_05785 [Mesorhizobium sp. B2-5-1]TPM61883.1 hypothetical protein FJ962_13120 [Mesorhizobium sp. B2-1-9]
MARKCVGGSLVPPGQTSWNIPALPNDEGGRQCTESGGNIVPDETTSCGASTSSVGQMTGSTSSAMSLTTAVLDPVRRVRDAFFDTHLVRSLALINDSDELIKIAMSDRSIAGRIAEGVGFLSSVSTAVLAENDKDPMLRLQYQPDLHEWVVALAKDVQKRLSSKDLHEAMEQAIGILDTYVGRTFGDVAADLKKGRLNSAT